MNTSSSLSPADVARLEEGRLAAALAATAAEHAPFAGGVMAYGGPGSWQNGACGGGLAGPVAEGEVDALVAFYEARGAEPRVDLAPFADPDLVRALSDRGFRVLAFENVLFRPLAAGDDYRALLPRGWPADDRGAPLEVTRVDPEDDAALRTLAAVAGSGFRPAGATLGEVELAAFARTARDPHTECFLARLGGVPAAAASMDAFPPVSALFGLTTLPPFRRRGIQLALAAVRLERARARGSTVATIRSRPGVATERNALRLGFQVAYTKVVLHRPAPGLEPAR